MLTVSIDEQDVKGFMNILFKESPFDGFEVRELSIVAFCELKIIGALSKTVKARNPETQNRAFALWSEVKPYAFNFIKGGVKPEGIKIIFSGAKTLLDEISPNAAAVFINMFYDAESVRFTAGVSQKEFSLNKDLDIKWEEYVTEFFKTLKVKFRCL